MTQPFNEFGDGITHHSAVVKNDDGVQWFNAFDVTSIYDHENRARYVYPAEALLDFFMAVRRDEVEVRHAETDAVVGRVLKFNRDIRGEFPNVIRVGIYFTVNPGEFENAVIRPVVKGQFKGDYDPKTGYSVTEVSEITGLVILTGQGVPSLGDWS